jgi:SNF2 family DNA or RNA helicase
MATSDNGFTQSIVDIEANMDMINNVLRNSLPVDDKQYYQKMLYNLHEQLKEAQTRDAPTAGPSGTNSYTSPRIVQMPSPPLNELSTSRKRGLEPTALPQAKRVSNQPSPVTPTSDILDAPIFAGSQQLVLPNRPSDPIQIIDLTESNSPSPEPLPGLPAIDPFPELVDAYQPNSEYRALASAFNQDFMDRAELAAFLLQPTVPGGGYGSQQQAVHLQAPGLANREVPYFPNSGRAPWLDPASESEDYGDLPLTGQQADAIEQLLENIKDHGEAPEDREPTPAKMSCTLKEYQKIGLTWLLKMENGKVKGGILADEMGLGKTVQALSLICANPSQDPLCKTTLIIAPVALMRQWANEIERHVLPRHKLRVYTYHNDKKNVDFSELRTYDVVLTTFGAVTSEFKKKNSPAEAKLVEQEMRNPNFRRHPKQALALLGSHCMWYRIIMDEAHNIKNRNAISSKAAADLQARHRLCMTGTPMMNSVDELYPLLRFLRLPQYIEWGKYSMDIARLVKDKNRPNLRKKGMDRLQILLKSIMLRRQKTSVVDGKEICTIPPKHTVQDNVEFSDVEHEVYKALEGRSQKMFNKFQENGTVTSNYAHILVLLLRLRQCCCHHLLITDLSQPATSGIAEDDLLGRAEQLSEDVVKRLKDFDSFECPICLEADPNPTIIVPCGHTVCGECVQKLIDPTRLEDNNEEAASPKCPHCRGDLKAKLITDYKHFCKVHCPDKLEPSDKDDDTSSDEESDSEIEYHEEVNKKGNLAGFVVDDEEEEDYQSTRAESSGLDSADEVEPKPKGKGKGKARVKPKTTLAQLKKDSLRNKAAKQRYLRRLAKTYTPSAKITKTVELLEEIMMNDSTEKTLIFSQFTSLLDLVEIPLRQKKIRYQRYDGSMKMDERDDAVNAFMDDPNENVMLVSLKAGNAGLNLWKASQVIILDPFWNPFIEDQAVDRAHRMPQPRKVTVHRVLVPETVEDRICTIQDQKREVVNEALDEQTSKGLSRLGIGELRYLFGLG